MNFLVGLILGIIIGVLGITTIAVLYTDNKEK